MRGDTRTVQAVAKPLPALTSGTALKLISPLKVLGQGTTNADISVQGSFSCDPARPAHPPPGNLYVHGTYTPAAPCSTQGAAVPGAFDPNAPAFAFPRVTRSDSRWWGLYPVPQFRDFVRYWSDEPYNFCSFFGWGARSSDSPLGVLADSRADCPNGVTMRTPRPGQLIAIPNTVPTQYYPPLVVTLTGDVTLVVTKFQLDGVLRFQADPATTREYAVAIVSPWPSDAQGCPDVPLADITLLNGGIVTGPRTRVLLYSSNAVQLGPSSTSDRMQKLTGQIAGLRRVAA